MTYTHIGREDGVIEGPQLTLVTGRPGVPCNLSLMDGPTMLGELDLTEDQVRRLIGQLKAVLDGPAV